MEVHTGWRSWCEEKITSDWRVGIKIFPICKQSSCVASGSGSLSRAREKSSSPTHAQEVVAWQDLFRWKAAPVSEAVLWYPGSCLEAAFGVCEAIDHVAAGSTWLRGKNMRECMG